MKTLKQSWIILIAMLVAAMALTACGENSKSGSERIGGTGDYINGGNNGNNGGDDNGDLDFCDDPDQLFTVKFGDITPKNGELNASTGTDIRIPFSHAPDPETLDGKFTLVNKADANDLPAFDVLLSAASQDMDSAEGLEPPASKVVILRLKQALKAGTTYVLTISSGGNGIQALACKDADNAKGLTFTDANGDPILDDNGNPVNEQSTEFTTNPGHLIDDNGNPVDHEGNPVDEGEEVDTNPNFLKIIKTHPTDGESVTVEDMRDNPAYVVFNQPVVEPENCGEEGSLIYLEKTAENGQALDNPVFVGGSCELSEDGTTITFIPVDEDGNSTDLEPNTDYVLHIAGEQFDVASNTGNGDGLEGAPTGGDDTNPENVPANLKDPNNEADGNDVHFSTNGPLAGSIVLPGTAPGITNNDGNPVAGADVEPEVHFNQPVDLGENNEIACGLEGSPVTLQNVDTGGFISGTCHVDPDDANTVIFTPDSPLDSGDNYKLTVQAGEAGFQPVDPDAELLKDPLEQEFGAADAMNRGACNASVIGSGDDKAEGVCLLGGPNGEGLVDALLADDGPLGPIASSLDEDGKAALVADLNALLANPDGDGSLGSLLQALVVDENGDFTNGGLANGLPALLIPGSGPNGEDTSLLTAILPGVAMGLPETLQGGVADLVGSLVTGNDAESCKDEDGNPGPSVGNVCLSNANGTGAADLLLGGDSFLSSAGLNQQQLTEAVATLLDSDGSVPGLLEGLIVDGNLQEGLAALLLGDESGSPLVNALDSVVGGLGDTLGGLLGLGGDDNPLCVIPIPGLCS